MIEITNEINGGGWVLIPENPGFDLEGRCSIQLSYGRDHAYSSGDGHKAQVQETADYLDFETR